MTRADTPLLSVRDLVHHFPIRRGFPSRQVGVVRAVDGVSFDVHRGETLGLVGESGSGKTTTGRALLHLIRPTAGTVTFDGVDIGTLDRASLRTWRRRAQIVFQDPFGSLNPRMTAGSAITEVLEVHGLAKADRPRRVDELLEIVGLGAEHADRYPHEFSGGQRQRIGIARALAVEPDFIVCDEPVSALDVSVQAQVLNLLQSLQRRLGIAYLFIAHDLAVVHHIADRIAVLYLGRIVESGSASDVVANPIHPYTRALLSAVPEPVPEERRRTRIVLPGDAPDPAHPPPGCPFHPRCPHPLRDEACLRARPALQEKATGHLAACIKEAATGGSGSLDTPTTTPVPSSAQ
jgi:oligopeptide/dipeptide ABC transporter ATP-binding protein